MQTIQRKHLTSMAGRLETTLGRAGKISVNDLNGCINELAKCETNCFSLHIYLTLNPLTAKSIRPTTTQSLLIRSCSSHMSMESNQYIKDLCNRLFETLSEKTDLDITHYNQILRGFVENNLDFDAINFLERM